MENIEGTQEGMFRFSAGSLRGSYNAELQGDGEIGAQLVTSSCCCVAFCLTGQFNQLPKHEIHFNGTLIFLISLPPVYLVLTLSHSASLLLYLAVLLYRQYLSINIYLFIYFFFQKGFLSSHKRCC